MAISTEPTGEAVQLTRVHVRPIEAAEESEWDRLMDSLHTLGNAQFAGHRIKYVAECGGRAVALLCFSASAYHLADRDRWIGWSEEQTMRRRHFVVQNSRFLILPADRPKNLASRVLSRCVRRLSDDWHRRFGFAPLDGEVQRAQTVDQGHGRIDTRGIEMAPATPVETGWPHTHVVCRVTREREIRRRGQSVSTSCVQVYYVGSFAATKYTPEQALGLVRGHWSIENGLHHRKDRSMDEDRIRTSGKGYGRVMCCIRSIAALVLGRARESISVVRRRLSGRTHLLLGLLSCYSVQHWERLCKPYCLG